MPYDFSHFKKEAGRRYEPAEARRLCRHDLAVQAHEKEGSPPPLDRVAFHAVTGDPDEAHFLKWLECRRLAMERVHDKNF